MKRVKTLFAVTLLPMYLGGFVMAQDSPAPSGNEQSEITVLPDGSTMEMPGQDWEPDVEGNVINWDNDYNPEDIHEDDTSVDFGDGTEDD